MSSVQVPIVLIILYCIALAVSWVALVFFAIQNNRYHRRWIGAIEKEIFDADHTEPVVMDSLGHTIHKKP